MKEITDRERQILKLRWNDGLRMTLGDVGKQFGVHRERIRQLEKRALKKIRSNVISGETIDFLDFLFPTNIKNSLRKSGHKYIYEIASLEESQLKRIRNFGFKRANQFVTLFEYMGIRDIKAPVVGLESRDVHLDYIKKNYDICLVVMNGKIEIELRNKNAQALT